MIRLELIDTVKKQFPNLDLSTKEGIIKFSKVVKAEIKLFGNFSPQEVEDVIAFLEKYGNTFDPLFNHKNIAIILRGKGENITLSPVRDKLPEETIQEFRTLFAENTLNYIKQCIKLNEWINLKNLFRAYPFIVDDWVKDETLKSLSLKNIALVTAIKEKEFIAFTAQYPYATDVSYFAMLSAVDNFYFDEDMLRINHALASSPKNTSDFLVLGNMMYALSFYNAYNEDVKQVLEANKRAAHAMLNITDSSTSRNSGYDDRMGCILYIVFIIFLAILIFVGGVEIPRGIVVVIILAMKLIFFLSKK